MVQAIHIENFRCFQDCRIEDFGRINLIGGKNNSGKTSLLEALLLGNVPTSESISFLQRVRMENTNYYRIAPETAWTNLFFGMDKSKKMRFVIHFPGAKMTTEITCVEISKKKQGNKKVGASINSDELIKVEDNTASLEISESRVNIINSRRYNRSIAYKLNELKPVETGSLEFHPVLHTFFVPAGFKKASGVLAREFDKAVALGKKESVLEGLKVIDHQITDVMTLSVGEPRIHIVREEENPQPLNFYGDALNKVVDILLRIINNPECLLLIDEVENGIHHSNHKKFWSMLLALTKEFNVQIFATSHSAEMISAFEEAATVGGFTDAVRYFEMFRSERSNQIVANKINLDTLAYQIKTAQPFRGD